MTTILVNIDRQLLTNNKLNVTVAIMSLLLPVQSSLVALIQSKLSVSLVTKLLERLGRMPEVPNTVTLIMIEN